MRALDFHSLASRMLMGACMGLCFPAMADEVVPTAARRIGEGSRLASSPETPESLSGSLFLGDALREADAPPALDAAPEDFSVPVAIAGTSEGGPAFRRFKVIPHFELLALYDSNIFIQQTQPSDDLILTLAPGAALAWGDCETRQGSSRRRGFNEDAFERGPESFLLFDATAFIVRFLDHESQSSLDGDLLAESQWALSKLTLHSQLHAERKSETNSEIGGRIERTGLTLSASAIYGLTAKTSLEWDLSHSIQDRVGFTKYKEWRGEFSVDYRPTAFWSHGLGGVLGAADVSSGEDQVFEQFFFKTAFNTWERLTLRGRAGVEFRQIAAGLPDRVNPVFELAAEYALDEQSALLLEASRRVENSVISPAETIASSSLSLELRRVLTERTMLLLGARAEQQRYSGSAGGTPRTDLSFLGRVALRYELSRWINAEFSYEFHRNDSTQPGSSFSDSQLALRLSLTY